VKVRVIIHKLFQNSHSKKYATIAMALSCLWGCVETKINNLRGNLDASYTLSTLSLSAESVVEGSSVEVTLSVVDQNNKPYIIQDLEPEFYIKSGTSQGTFGAIQYMGGGKYSAKFTGTFAANPITIGAKIRTAAVEASTPPLDILPYVPYVPTLAYDFMNESILPTNGSMHLTYTRSATNANTTIYGVDGYLRRAAHNVLLHSQAMDEAVWIANFSTVTANAMKAPDGTLTAEKITEDSSLDGHNVHQSSAVVAGEPYSASVYAKAGERTKLNLSILGAGYWPGGTNPSIKVDLTDCTMLFINNLSTYSVKSVGDGWCRISITQVASSSGAGSGITTGPVVSPPSVTYAGDGTSGLYLWGAQFERNHSASYYAVTSATAQYNVPRFDYDPVTHVPLGVLVETNRSNAFTYATLQTHANWTKSDVTVSASVETNPMGDPALKMTENGISGVHQLTQNINYASAATYTMSIYAKKAENRFLQLHFSAAAFAPNAYANFDLNDGAISSTGADATAFIQDVGRGWYRLSITAVASVATNGSSGPVLIQNGTDGVSPAYVGTPGNGVYIFGAQHEVGDFSTSLILSTTGAAAR
jgi:hypothetical protein